MLALKCLRVWRLTPGMPSDRHKRPKRLAKRVGADRCRARGIQRQHVAVRLGDHTRLGRRLSHRARCSRRTATVKASSATRRAWWDLGGPSTHPPSRSFLIDWRTWSRPASRSTSLHRSPASSPRRKPVVAAMARAAASTGCPRSSAAEISCCTTAGVGICLGCTRRRGGVARAVGAVDSSPHLTAWRRAAESTRWRWWTLLGSRPSSSHSR